MPEDLVEKYKKFGLNVAKHNGNNKCEIPISATFVIDKNMVIRCAFGRANYNERAQPENIENKKISRGLVRDWKWLAD